MTTIRKTGLGLLGLFSVSVLSLALAISYDDECLPAVNAGSAGVHAVTYTCYGSTEVLQYARKPKPVPTSDELLVRVHNAGINPLDWHYMRGSPYLMRLQSGLGAPKIQDLGVDFAGVVEAVGANVTRFEVGDAVFGGANGAFSDYLVIREDRGVAHKPENVSFAEAAGVPIAALTALQALRNEGQLQPGQHVLVNGASGGVGTYAVQLAKAMGAKVTGVCSDRNAELVKSLGADYVINYKTTNYAEQDTRYDLIIDNVGNHSPAANAGVMTENGRLIMVGGPSGNWVGPLTKPIAALLYSPFASQEFILLMALVDAGDLAVLGEYMARGEITTVIDRRFSLADTAQAIAYSESGRARGKIIIDMGVAE